MQICQTVNEFHLFIHQPLAWAKAAFWYQSLEAYWSFFSSRFGTFDIFFAWFFAAVRTVWVVLWCMAVIVPCWQLFKVRWQLVLTNHAAFDISSCSVLSNLHESQLLADDWLFAWQVLKQALLVELSCSISGSGDIVDPTACLVSIWILNAILDLLEGVELLSAVRTSRLGLPKCSDLQLVGGFGHQACETGLNHSRLIHQLSDMHITGGKIANRHDIIVAEGGNILSPGSRILLILVVPTWLVNGRLFRCPRVLTMRLLVIASIASIATIASVATISSVARPGSPFGSYGGRYE